ncbi:MAG: EAL and modified HD-GYP domain-containing signal transduction protein, partial [Planctomycetota bacterium]
MSEVFVGRQPIYNRALEVIGYELLFRRGNEQVAQIDDGDQATSQVILNAFHEIGIKEVVGERLAFVNLTRAFIVGEYELPLPTEGVVLEVLEHIDPDDEVLDGLRRLKACGYTIALDDFVLNDRTARMLEFASLVKLDILDLGWQEVESQVASLRKRDLTLLAEQVRTLEDFERCCELGFDLYQGYFLSRSYTVRGRRMKPNRLAVVHELVTCLSSNSDPAATMQSQAEFSSWYKQLDEDGLRSLLVGNEQSKSEVRRVLAATFAFCQLEDRPKALFANALSRAAMCAGLSEQHDPNSKPGYFLTGLLSYLGTLLECSLARIIEDLPLSANVRIALLSNT